MSKAKAKNPPRKKRVVIMSDLHCGHLVGLTPPHWQSRAARGTWRYKASQLQADCWKWYTETLDALKPIDILIANGDLIDGSGDRSGGTELITTNRASQAEMATTALKYAKAKDYVLTYGTGYHTGNEEDFEDEVVKALKAEESINSVKIGSHEWVDVNGCIFDCKHHLGSSGIPHGRFTAIAKDQLWNELWAGHEEQPKADVIVRSHVHYHIFCGTSDWMGLTMPALQAMGTKYGSRRCSGRIDYGFTHFDVNTDGSYAWQLHKALIKRQRAKALKL